ncbi:DUF115 domain-containing protein [Pectobacterium cacticida]|uniref:6-hydroxymethylpterin diphosphokinase MptE-like protein n=1 Tax=Pectobacterium cacticida TaxID=69221 RepID=UPI002FF11E59
MKKIFNDLISIWNFIPEFFILMVKYIKLYKRRGRIIPSQLLSSDCVIVGNGPSLKKDFENLKSLKEKVFFVVNHFADSELYEFVKPAFYCFLDPYFWSDMASVEAKEKRNKTFNNIVEKTKWPIDIYIPCYAKENVFSILSNNKNINLITYNALNTVHVPIIIEKLYFSCGLFAPCANNVILHSLYIAIRKGFKKIYLYGVDTSMHESLIVDQESNTVYAEYSHFYGTTKILQNESGLRNKSLTIAECLQKETDIFRTYEALGRYSNYCGCKILNCSSYSLIDCFERLKCK